MSRFEQVSLKDNFGFQGQFTPIRDFKVAEPYRMVGTTFHGSLDTNFWTATTSGTGSASGVATGKATISSGTANSGYGQLCTAQNARFMFAHPMQYRGAIRIPDTTIALNTRRWGSFSVSTITPQNGAYFELSATGVLSVVTVSGGTPTAVSAGSFNGDVSTYTVDTNVHAYEIIEFTMGIWFYIDDVLIHKIIPTTDVLYEDLDVPICMTTENTAGGTTSGTIECFNSVIMRLGREETGPAYYHIAGAAATHTLKVGPGKLQKIMFNNTSGTNITIYDNTAASGTVIGIITTTSAAIGEWEYNVAFNTGLTMVTVGNSLDATVIYE